MGNDKPEVPRLAAVPSRRSPYTGDGPALPTGRRGLKQIDLLFQALQAADLPLQDLAACISGTFKRFSGPLDPAGLNMWAFKLVL